MSLAVEHPRELALVDSSNSLALAVVGPLDRHPAAVYLISAMPSALNRYHLMPGHRSRQSKTCSSH